MEAILSQAGHVIVGFARDEDAAVKMAGGHRADLALVDLHLARDTSGAVAARQLRTCYGTPSLFVSAAADECRKAAEEAGALGCLSKPFRAKDLVGAVAIVEMIIRGQTPQRMPQGLELYDTGWPPRV
jgi:CheY-like chemotaxis protein